MIVVNTYCVEYRVHISRIFCFRKLYYDNFQTFMLMVTKVYLILFNFGFQTLKL
jgi:hypothetical protein